MLVLIENIETPLKMFFISYGGDSSPSQISPLCIEAWHLDYTFGNPSSKGPSMRVSKYRVVASKENYFRDLPAMKSNENGSSKEVSTKEACDD